MPSNASVQINNTLGQLVYSGQLDEPGAYDARQLARGSYAVQLTTNRGHTGMTRFIRQ